MRTLNIYIGQDGRVESDTYAGTEGEHNYTKIVVYFKSNPPEAAYFRMLFQNSAGSNITTGKLTVSEGRLSYNLNSDVTTLGNPLFWQLFGYKNSPSGVATLIYKSNVAEFSLSKSLIPSATSAVSPIDTELEEALSSCEEFAESFSLAATLAEPADGSAASVNVTHDGWAYNLAFNIPHSVSQAVTANNLYSYNTLFGNQYMPTSLTREQLYFAKTGRLINVCGAVEFIEGNDRGHSENGAQNAVLYLPFVPVAFTGVTLFDSDANSAHNLVAEVIPVDSKLSIISGTPINNHVYRMSFSYISAA